MKTTIKHIVKIVLISSIFLSLSSYAQAPQKMSYQAVLRNASNALVSNTPVAIRVSVLQGSASGTAVYVERHTLTTNVNGLATFEIGSGTLISGTFSGINWASGEYFVKTETDPAGGTNYTISGTSQLLSVPYALYAKNVDGISATSTTNWNSAYAWGNHAGLYRPITYVPNWSEVINKPAFAPVATTGNYNDLTNKPANDGSETKVTAGTNVTVTGSGTTANPYVVNSTGTSGNTSQWATTGNNISNTNTGNVGIGVSDPEYKLDLGGRMRIRATPGTRAGLWLNNEANTASPAFIGMQSDNKVGFYGSGSGWGLAMNTENGALSINGSAGSAGQVPTSNGDNLATSWTKLGNLLQTYYRYTSYAANIPTGDANVFEFGGGSMAINATGKSRLIISAMFTAYAACGICTEIRYSDIRLKVDGVPIEVFRIEVSPNGVQQVSLSNYFFDVAPGNHSLVWELKKPIINVGFNYPVTSAFIKNVTVMVLPID